MTDIMNEFMNLGKGSVKEREIDLFVEKSMQILDRVHAMLKEQGISQKELAKRMGKNESEVSKWLNGVQNFTLKTLCKLEVALEQDIIVIPESFSHQIKVTVLEDSLVIETNNESITWKTDFSSGMSSSDKPKTQATSQKSTDTNNIYPLAA